MKTTSVGGVRGFDGAKKVSGRKRHLLVETQGLVLRARVHTAALQDRAAVPLLLEDAPGEFPRLAHVWVDQGYTGSGRAWIERELGWSVEVVSHPRKASGIWWPIGEPIPAEVWAAARPKGFRGVLPRRWVVEIILTQLTKARVEAAFGGRHHVADLHIVVSHHDPVNQQLDQRASLLVRLWAPPDPWRCRRSPRSAGPRVADDARRSPGHAVLLGRNAETIRGRDVGRAW